MVETENNMYLISLIPRSTLFCSLACLFSVCGEEKNSEVGPVACRRKIFKGCKS